MSRRGYGWFFGAFVLLIVAGGLIASAAATFLASLAPLYVAIALSVGAVVCALLALGRHTENRQP